MKKLSILLAGILIMAGMSSATAQNVWSLQKCIDYALENNIQIKQQQLGAEYNQNLVNQARSDRLPDFNASLSQGLNFGRTLDIDNTYDNRNSTSISGGVSSRVTLWNGFTLQNTILQRDLDLQATVQDLRKAKDDIMLNIAAGYLEILFAEELEMVSAAQIEVTKQQIDRTTQLVEAGSLARGALLEIEAQLAREELQRVNDQNRVQLAYLALYQLLELPLAESFKIEKPTLPEIKAHESMINSIDVFSNALEIRPEIKAAWFRVESAKRQLEIAKGSRYPNLSFGANYNNGWNNTYKDFSGNQMPVKDQLKTNERIGLGLNLNIPIFNRYQVRNAISNSTLQIADYEYRLQSTKNLLRKDIEQAYTNALASLNRYISSEKAVSSMQEAFRYTEEKFNVGMVNSVEYNQSKNNLTQAQSELLQARYEYIFRIKILDFYQGIPISL